MRLRDGKSRRCRRSLRLTRRADLVKCLMRKLCAGPYFGSRSRTRTCWKTNLPRGPCSRRLSRIGGCWTAGPVRFLDLRMQSRRGGSLRTPRWRARACSPLGSCRRRFRALLRPWSLRKCGRWYADGAACNDEVPGLVGTLFECRTDILQSPKQPLRFTSGATFRGGRAFEEALTGACEYAFELCEHHLLRCIHEWGPAHIRKCRPRPFCSEGSMKIGVGLAVGEETVA